MSAIEYFQLLSDTPRIESFRRAIEAVVSPGRVALDLGTGVGTYALFAARAGARVYAVEADPIIEIARQLAADNGLADRVVFLEGLAADLELPERADVLIFEDYAPSLCASETVALLRDVRRRWLMPDALSIPRRLRLMLAPVTCPDDYASLERRTYAPDSVGLDLHRLTHRVLNSLHRAAWQPHVLLAEPSVAVEVDPLAAGDLVVDARATWGAESEAELHGLGLWLDMELAEGLFYSNGPAARPTSWGQVFLPLGEPVPIAAGSPIDARVWTVGGASTGSDVWWKWRVAVGDTVQEMDTFRGAPLSMGRLRRARLDHRPQLGPTGRLRLAALQLMDGEHSVGEIVETLRARFADELDGAGEAYRLVAKEVEAAMLESERRPEGSGAQRRQIREEGTRSDA